jgi:hypothetical protein
MTASGRTRISNSLKRSAIASRTGSQVSGNFREFKRKDIADEHGTEQGRIEAMA